MPKRRPCTSGCGHFASSPVRGHWQLLLDYARNSIQFECKYVFANATPRPAAGVTTHSSAPQHIRRLFSSSSFLVHPPPLLWPVALSGLAFDSCPFVVAAPRLVGGVLAVVAVLPSFKLLFRFALGAVGKAGQESRRGSRRASRRGRQGNQA